MRDSDLLMIYERDQRDSPHGHCNAAFPSSADRRGQLQAPVRQAAWVQPGGKVAVAKLPARIPVVGKKVN